MLVVCVEFCKLAEPWLQGCFFVRLSGVSKSRPAFHNAPRKVAVNAGRRPPPKAARSGVDGREHGAIVCVAGPLMPPVQDKAKVVAIKELLERDEDFVRSAVQSFVQTALEAEMSEVLGAEKRERTEGRLGDRSGYYSRALITRVGTCGFRKTGRAECYSLDALRPKGNKQRAQIT